MTIKQTFGMRSKVMQGFTLMELMITVAILGILGAIAYPSYVAQIQKSKRSDAMVALQDMAQRQESYFLRNYSYASTLTQLNYPNISSQGLYSVSVEVTPVGCTGVQTSSCSAFTLSAAAVSSKPQAADKTCQTFTLDNRGSKAAKDKDGNAVTTCWN
ncbi:MAG: hypothetical protein RI964_1303 [Pseudomonadota bacterium]|jgi:type IV pilus assembly protein PilE